MNENRIYIYGPMCNACGDCAAVCYAEARQQVGRQMSVAATVNTIAHCFTSLANALPSGTGGAKSTLGTSNLVTGNYVLNIPCYNDAGADTVTDAAPPEAKSAAGTIALSCVLPRTSYSGSHCSSAPSIPARNQNH
jgi:ferredoxin